MKKEGYMYCIRVIMKKEGWMYMSNHKEGGMDVYE